MKNQLIRFATDADIDAMLAIYAYYVQHTSVTFDHETPSLEKFKEKINSLQKQFPVLVYAIDGEIVGYAYASLFREKRAYQWTVETTIYLKPSYKGSGIGSQLYSSLFDILRKQHIRYAIAVITIPNDESLLFHQKFGFEHAGTLEEIGYKMNQWWSITMMRKCLLENNSPVLDPIAISEMELLS